MGIDMCLRGAKLIDSLFEHCAACGVIESVYVTLMRWWSAGSIGRGLLYLEVIVVCKHLVKHKLLFFVRRGKRGIKTKACSSSCNWLIKGVLSIGPPLLYDCWSVQKATTMHLAFRKTMRDNAWMRASPNPIQWCIVTLHPNYLAANCFSFPLSI